VPWLVRAVSVCRIAGWFGAVVLTTAVLLGPVIGTPSASAGPCPDVEVVFARGTFEPAGVGATGAAFVDALRSQVGGKSVDVYPVNYPASLDFATAADGVIDASNKVRDMAASCPNTKMVLGGYSQGAAVIGYITEDGIPAGFTRPAGITGPMSPTLANHVAAGGPVRKTIDRVLANNPRRRAADHVGHLYAAKTATCAFPMTRSARPPAPTTAHTICMRSTA
jgi:cutinase